MADLDDGSRRARTLSSASARLLERRESNGAFSGRKRPGSDPGDRDPPQRRPRRNSEGRRIVVVEAVFEDLDVKKTGVRQAGTRSADRTRSWPRTRLELHWWTTSPQGPPDIRSASSGCTISTIPAKNRLVEVDPGLEAPRMHDIPRGPGRFSRGRSGKTPIAVRRLVRGSSSTAIFVPWINEAVRLLEEGVADIATIEAASKQRPPSASGWARSS